ncbi:hypothetical protein E2C01_040605 [Portunus trituberculatus]|uniref:Uncharacterized protein n=1 Tax=Portunus trituberculatus TaxID=210409 RepID=A0A5B7FR83_PORTR|nr:hypothetical protein [Portunus trituberculatus]
MEVFCHGHPLGNTPEAMTTCLKIKNDPVQPGGKASALSSKKVPVHSARKNLIPFDKEQSKKPCKKKLSESAKKSFVKSIESGQIQTDENITPKSVSKDGIQPSQTAEPQEIASHIKPILPTARAPLLQNKQLNMCIKESGTTGNAQVSAKAKQKKIHDFFKPLSNASDKCIPNTSTTLPNEPEEVEILEGGK